MPDSQEKAVVKPEDIMKKLRELLREDLGDVSEEEYNDFLAFEAKTTPKLIAKCRITLAELKSEFITFVDVARSYYMNFTVLLTIGTFKKLKPNATAEEMKMIYFAAWMMEWLNVLMIVLDDVFDDGIQRALQPTLPRQLGSANATCYAILIENILYDMAEEKFSDAPFRKALLDSYRKAFEFVMINSLIDSSSKKYQRLLDAEWHHARDFSSAVATVGMYATDVAISVANITTDSEVQRTTEQLSWLLGTYLRVVDDVDDIAKDTQKGSLNWGYMTAWRRANYENRQVLKKANNDQMDQVTFDSILDIYKTLNVEEQLLHFRQEQTTAFINLLENCPEQIARKSWTASWSYVTKLFTLASECT